MATPDSGPVPLRLPAILQNPVDHARRQREAHTEQQRQRAAARRAERAEADNITGSKRGKRVVRRMDNATLAHNPHAVQPSRSDYAPTVPLHYHVPRASFPAGAIERRTVVPPAAARLRDPFAPSSVQGAFSTSLKGTRALLRRRGRRAETTVPAVENAVRAWLSGDYGPHEGWRVIEASPAADNVPNVQGAASSADNVNGVAQSSSPSSSRPRSPGTPGGGMADGPSTSLPVLPPLPSPLPSILELSRSPAQLTWYAPDSFDRLVLHMVARYYELVSWSSDGKTIAGEDVRLTHLIRPAVARARAPPPSHALATPETSDASLTSEGEVVSSGAETDPGTDDDGEATETEREAPPASGPATGSLSARFGVYGESDSDGPVPLSARFGTTEGEVGELSDSEYSLAERFSTLSYESAGSGYYTPEFEDGLALTRTTSNLSQASEGSQASQHSLSSLGSSAYASSEGSDWEDLGDQESTDSPMNSFHGAFPPVATASRHVNGHANASANASASASANVNGARTPLSAALDGRLGGSPPRPQRLGGAGVEGLEGRPTFFQFVFGE